VLPTFLSGIEQSMVATSLSVIAAGFGRPDAIGWVAAAYLVGAAISAPVYGRLGDDHGLARLLTVSLALFLAGAVMCAASRSIEMLVLSRFLQGLGGGGLIPLGQALLGATTLPRDRAVLLSYLVSFSFIANTFGPAVGGILLAAAGWPAIFLFNVPIGTMAVVLVLRVRRQAAPRRRGTGSLDWVGLLLLTTLILCLLSLLQGAHRDTETGRAAFVALMAVAVLVAAAGLMWWERRFSNPLLPPALLGNASVWRCILLAALYGALFTTLVTYVPFFLRIWHGAGLSNIGLMMMPLLGGIGVGSLTTGQLIRRTGRTTVFTVAGLSGVAVLLGLFAAVGSGMTPWQGSAFLGLAGLLMGTTLGVTQLTVQMAAGPLWQGTAASAVQLARSLGASLGVAIAGVFLAVADLPNAVPTWLPFASIFLFTAVLAAAGAALAWTIPQRNLTV
jgi:MFS family permease